MREVHANRVNVAADAHVLATVDFLARVIEPRNFHVPAFVLWHFETVVARRGFILSDRVLAYLSKFSFSRNRTCERF